MSTAAPHQIQFGDGVPVTRVADVMHPGLVSCDRTATASEVARIMATSATHCVAVLGTVRDDGAQPAVWGIVSDLDLLSAAADPSAGATAGDLAAQPVISVAPGMALTEAATVMVAYRAQHVLVVDPERHVPLGVLSTLDVVKVLAGDAPGAPSSVLNDIGG